MKYVNKDFVGNNGCSRKKYTTVWRMCKVKNNKLKQIAVKTPY
jgi:hypothetical protein